MVKKRRSQHPSFFEKDMKKWIITYEGSLLPFQFESETYGESKEEAIDYAVNTYKISRNRIVSCEPKDTK